MFLLYHFYNPKVNKKRRECIRILPKGRTVKISEEKGVTKLIKDGAKIKCIFK